MTEPVFRKFPHIGQFYEARHHGERTDNPVVDYIGTVKLHGTNAGVQITPDGGVFAQSRSRILSPEEDNFGFAAYVEENAKFFRFHVGMALNWVKMDSADAPITVYGEWCGPGIQRGVAVSHIKERTFVPFGILIAEDRIFTYPTELHTMHYTLSVDFSSEESCKVALEGAESIAEGVGARCPWGAANGVEGPGEGVVWIPTMHPERTKLWFKTKSEHHRKASKTPRAKTSPEDFTAIDSFLDSALSKARLDQGLQAVRESTSADRLSMANLGDYLKWIGGDVKREFVLDIETSNLHWPTVAKRLTLRAKRHFIDMLNGQQES